MRGFDGLRNAICSWVVQLKAIDGCGKDSAVITFLYNWSFTDTPYPFDEIMVHERVHGSGEGIRRHYLFGVIPLPILNHDLEGMDGFESILKNCRIPESFK